MPINKEVERVLYRTTDPTVSLDGHPCPAMTTMLYRVCDNDGDKFAEATRLVELFIAQALNDPQQNGTTPAERRVANGVATLPDYIAVGDPQRIIEEVLGEEYGGGDARRSAIANRIVIALRQSGKLHI